MKEYEIFLPAGVELTQGEEIDLTLRDADTLESFDARVIISKDVPQLVNADHLWIRREDVGNVRREPEPYAIRILVRHDEPADEVRISRKEVPMAERHGWMLRSLLEDGTEKESGESN